MAEITRVVSNARRGDHSGTALRPLSKYESCYKQQVCALCRVAMGIHSTTACDRIRDCWHPTAACKWLIGVGAEHHRGRAAFRTVFSSRRIYVAYSTRVIFSPQRCKRQGPGSVQTTGQRKLSFNRRCMTTAAAQDYVGIFKWVNITMAALNKADFMKILSCRYALTTCCKLGHQTTAAPTL